MIPHETIKEFVAHIKDKKQGIIQCLSGIQSQEAIEADKIHIQSPSFLKDTMGKLALLRKHAKFE